MQSLAIRPSQALTAKKTFSDFSHFEWSPQLYLSELHRFRLQIYRQQWQQSSQLLNKLFRLLEEVIFDESSSSLKLLLQSSTHFISTIQSYHTNHSHDLHSSFLRRMETQLSLLEVNASNDEMIKDLAVCQLSALMSKCQGKVEVQNEIETIAFILDRFLKARPQEESLDINFDAQIFSRNSFPYIMPLSAVIKIIPLEAKYWHRPLNGDFYYAWEQQLIPLRDVDGKRQGFSLSPWGILIEEDGQAWIILADQLGTIGRKIQGKKGQRTAIHQEKLYFHVRKASI